MPPRLSLAQQRKLLRALPAARINAVKKHCRLCEMRGEGLMSILKSVGKALGPIAKEIGPVVLKEMILPLLKKKLGMGLTPAGGTLRLAGQGAMKRRRRKKSMKRT